MPPAQGGAHGERARPGLPGALAQDGEHVQAVDDAGYAPVWWAVPRRVQRCPGRGQPGGTARRRHQRCGGLMASTGLPAPGQRRRVPPSGPPPAVCLVGGTGTPPSRAGPLPPRRPGRSRRLPIYTRHHDLNRVAAGCAPHARDSLKVTGPAELEGTAQPASMGVPPPATAAGWRVKRHWGQRGCFAAVASCLHSKATVVYDGLGVSSGGGGR